MEDTKEKIPYIVINRRNTDVHMECESDYKEKLQETFMNVLQTCMEYHEFCFVDESKLFGLEDDDGEVASLDEEVASLDEEVASLDEEVASLDEEVASLDEEVASLDEEVADLEDLVCDDCGCRVVQKKYITIVNKVKYCGACKPTTSNIDKSIYDRFQKFLDKKGGSSEIWYFVDNDWIKFTVD